VVACARGRAANESSASNAADATARLNRGPGGMQIEDFHLISVARGRLFDSRYARIAVNRGQALITGDASELPHSTTSRLLTMASLAFIVELQNRD